MLNKLTTIFIIVTVYETAVLTLCILIKNDGAFKKPRTNLILTELVP